MLCLVSLVRGGINNGESESESLAVLRNSLVQWEIFGEESRDAAQRKDEWRKKKTFYREFANRPPLDGVVVRWMLYTWLRGKCVFLL